VVGLSQGTLVAHATMARLADDPTAPPARKVTFYEFASPNRAGFGLANLLPVGFTIPVLNYTVGATPVSRYNTVVVYTQYDGWADFPNRPWNVVADLNAIIGADYLHTPTAFSSPSQAVLVSSTANSLGGITTTYMIPTNQLPLTQSLRDIGVPTSVTNKIDDVLRPIVNAGYSSYDPNGGPYILHGQLMLPPTAPTGGETMHLALRPYVAADVALVGAGVIVASPLAPQPPDIRVAAPAVQLALNAATEPPAVIANGVLNGGDGLDFNPASDPPNVILAGGILNPGSRLSPGKVVLPGPNATLQGHAPDVGVDATGRQFPTVDVTDNHGVEAGGQDPTPVRGTWRKKVAERVESVGLTGGKKVSPGATFSTPDRPRRAAINAVAGSVRTSIKKFGDNVRKVSDNARRVTGLDGEPREAGGDSGS
jgi:PE-PPE domain